MIELFAEVLSQQAANAAASEGLPYWIFWLLISFILLLLAFIFLRDKELRRKMDDFFFRTRKELIKYRHQRRMAKEERKKERLTVELGQKAWDRRIEIKNGTNVFRELQYLEEKKGKLEKEAEDIKAKISFLNTSLDENSKKVDVHLSEKEDERSPHVAKLLELKGKENTIEVDITEKQEKLVALTKDIHSTKKELHEVEEGGLGGDDGKKAEAKAVREKLDRLDKEKEDLEKKIKTLVEKKAEFENQRKELEKSIEDIEKEIAKIEHDRKHRVREYQKEIREWEKSQNKVGDKILKVDKEKEPLFEQYGGLVEKERVSDRELATLYSQIDRVKTRIEEIEKQIETLD
jgi:chromosome segregation ATPase